MSQTIAKFDCVISEFNKNYYVKIRDIIKQLETEGWVMVRQKGSHRQYKHPDRQSLITIPDHGGNKEPSVGVLLDIMKKAGWK